MTGSCSDSPGMVSSNCALEREGLNAEGSLVEPPEGCPWGAPSSLSAIRATRLLRSCSCSIAAACHCMHPIHKCGVHVAHALLTVGQVYTVKCRLAQYEAVERS